MKERGREDCLLPMERLSGEDGAREGKGDENRILGGVKVRRGMER